MTTERGFYAAGSRLPEAPGLVPILGPVLILASITQRQGIGMLAAVLLLALVLVAVLTAAAMLLLGLHRRHSRRGGGRSSAPTQLMDAWRESGRRGAPPECDEE